MRITSSIPLTNEQIKSELEKEYSRRKLLGFVKHCFQSTLPFVTNWYHKKLCNTLMQFLADVDAGLSPQLMVFCPPRHSKSETISRMFPAFCYGHNPYYNIIACSYSDDLAGAMNRDCQRIILSDQYKELFPNTTIADKTNSELIKDVVQRNSTAFDVLVRDKDNKLLKAGQYRGAGVGAGITGMGFDIGIIDDPIKNAEDAQSETIRNKVAEWYETVFLTRKSPKSGIIILMTRWHVDDLAGRLLDKEPDKWKVVRFPAIAIEDEEFRKKGEALHPDRYPINILLDFKSKMSESNWSALYQQNPIIEGGNLYKLEWFKFIPSYELPQKYDFTFIVADTAYKDKEQNDYTVFMYAGVFENRLYIIDMLRKKIKALDVVDWCEPWINKKIDDTFRYLWIEPKGHGIYLNQYFSDKRVNIPDEEELNKVLDRTKDKVMRANNSIAWINKKDYNVIINKDMQDIEEFKTEILAFNKGDHDDIEDCFCDCIKIGLARKDYGEDLRRMLYG